jgi:phosphoglycolate phosphatase-like HAD superfamily hydrolase
MSKHITTSDPAQTASPRAIILDWDGVIADSLGLYVNLYQQVCKHFGRGTPPSDAATFRRWYQPRWETNYLDMGYTEAELEEVIRYANTQVRYDQTPLFDEVVDALRDLEGRVALGICSTSDSRLIRDRLALAGLERAFAAVVGGEDGGSDKVARFALAAQLLDVEHHQAVAVGDTPHDVECGQHWGMTTVGVTYGWCEAERVAAARPHHLIASPQELRACLTKLTASA